MSFFTGSKAKNYNQSTLEQGQQSTKNQLFNAAAGQQGAGGAFGMTADYYRSLFDEDNDTYNKMKAPEMRQFNEQIIPGLSEQFANMGSGGLSSSGFRNAAVSAGTDLSERLGAIRANLRQQGAAGLANIGQQALGNYSQQVHQPGTEGLVDYIGPAIGGAIGSFGGPVGTAVGAGIGNWAQGAITNKGKSSPFGNAPQPQQSQSKFGLPNFLNS